MWSRLGFLVAELFVALAMIFLVGSTVGHVPPPPPTPTPPTPTVLINCGLDLQYLKYNDRSYSVLPNPEALRSGQTDPTYAAAVAALAAKIKVKFATETRTAGLVEVFGSGTTPSLGANLSRGVIDALKAAGGPFASKRTIYQPLSDIYAPYGTVYFWVFYYVTAVTCS